MDDYPLFKHMADEHGLTLLESQLWDIIHIVLKMYGKTPEQMEKMNPQEKVELIKHYLEPTGLTISELVDRDAYVPLLQLLEAYRNSHKPQTVTEQVDEQVNSKGNQLDEVYGAMKTKTAVEYLAERYNYITWMRNRDEISAGTADQWRDKVLKKAKEMEKEQIIAAYKEGCSDEIFSESTDDVRAEEYYNETYGEQ